MPMSSESYLRKESADMGPCLKKKNKKEAFSGAAAEGCLCLSANITIVRAYANPGCVSV